MCSSVSDQYDYPLFSFVMKTVEEGPEVDSSGLLPKFCVFILKILVPLTSMEVCVEEKKNLELQPYKNTGRDTPASTILLNNTLPKKNDTVTKLKHQSDYFGH